MHIQLQCFQKIWMLKLILMNELKNIYIDFNINLEMPK